MSVEDRSVTAVLRVAGQDSGSLAVGGYGVSVLGLITPAASIERRGVYSLRSTPEMRFWRRVWIMPSGCWEFQGARNKDGYGVMGLDGGQILTHRFAYIRAHGPIESRLVVMHTCDNPACVRLVHLRLGTMADNNADMDEKGRRALPWNRLKTHCKRGHEFTPENIYRPPRKPRDRLCRECRRMCRRAATERRIQGGAS